jgi:hypothetical protein
MSGNSSTNNDEIFEMEEEFNEIRLAKEISLYEVENDNLVHLSRHNTWTPQDSIQTTEEIHILEEIIEHLDTDRNSILTNQTFNESESSYYDSINDVFNETETITTMKSAENIDTNGIFYREYDKNSNDLDINLTTIDSKISSSPSSKLESNINSEFIITRTDSPLCDVVLSVYSKLKNQQERIVHVIESTTEVKYNINNVS